MPLTLSTTALSQCTSTIFCYLRVTSLWTIAIIVLLFGALRSRITTLITTRNPSSPKKSKASSPAL